MGSGVLSGFENRYGNFAFFFFSTSQNTKDFMYCRYVEKMTFDLCK